MAYELWRIPAASLFGTFDAEADALAAVRREAEAHGREYAEQFALGFENTRGRSRPIAAGAELVNRALAAEAETRPLRA